MQSVSAAEIKAAIDRKMARARELELSLAETKGQLERMLAEARALTDETKQLRAWLAKEIATAQELQEKATTKTEAQCTDEITVIKRAAAFSAQMQWYLQHVLEDDGKQMATAVSVAVLFQSQPPLPEPPKWWGSDDLLSDIQTALVVSIDGKRSIPLKLYAHAFDFLWHLNLKYKDVPRPRLFPDVDWAIHVAVDWPRLAVGFYDTYAYVSALDSESPLERFDYIRDQNPLLTCVASFLSDVESRFGS